VASRSCSLLAVRKRRTTTRCKPVQHTMYMTALNHRRTGGCHALIVLAVPAIPAMPGVGACNHPALLQGCEAAHACWTHLHCDAPARPMRGHPGGQRLVVILLIRKDGDEPWKDLGRHEVE